MPDTSASPVRVLIVEDDLAALDVFRDMLEDLGATVATASSVVEGRVKLASFAPTLVITDVYMPGENGLVMRAEVRHWNPVIPVVALTGADEAAVSPDAGFFTILRKPVSMATLQELLASVPRP